MFMEYIAEKERKKKIRGANPGATACRSAELLRRVDLPAASIFF
jgi:hypothetical protein